MVIYLHGSDTYRSRQKLQELTAKFRRDVDTFGTEMISLSGATMRPGDFRNACIAQSMFETKRMIVVEGAIAQGKQPVHDEILATLASPGAAGTNIVVFWEDVAPKPKKAAAKKKTPKPAARASRSGRATPVLSESASKKKIHDFLLEQEYVQEFPSLAGAKLVAWIEHAVATRGGTIERPASLLLAAIVGGNLWRMVNEIDKLIHGTETAITATQVEAQVIAKTESAIFDLTDALGVRNRSRALSLLRDELAAGSAPLYILTMLARQIRILLMTTLALRTGGAGQNLAVTLGLHPFVVQKARAQLQHFSFTELKHLHRRLSVLDTQMKSAGGDPAALLTLFIATAVPQ